MILSLFSIYTAFAKGWWRRGAFARRNILVTDDWWNTNKSTGIGTKKWFIVTDWKQCQEWNVTWNHEIILTIVHFLLYSFLLDDLSVYHFFFLCNSRNIQTIQPNIGCINLQYTQEMALFEGLSDHSKIVQLIQACGNSTNINFVLILLLFTICRLITCPKNGLLMLTCHNMLSKC